MVLLLSLLPYDELIAQPDLKQYAGDCDYFGMQYCASKQAVKYWIEAWVPWYGLFHTETLYVTVVSDREWSAAAGTLDGSVHCTTWKNMPKSGHDADNYPRLFEGQIIHDMDIVKSIWETLKIHDLNKSIYQFCSPQR